MDEDGIFAARARMQEIVETASKETGRHVAPSRPGSAAPRLWRVRPRPKMERVEPSSRGW